LQRQHGNNEQLRNSSIATFLCKTRTSHGSSQPWQGVLFVETTQ
jgi:hypothetical protein